MPVSWAEHALPLAGPFAIRSKRCLLYLCRPDKAKPPSGVVGHQNAGWRVAYPAYKTCWHGGLTVRDVLLF